MRSPLLLLLSGLCAVQVAQASTFPIHLRSYSVQINPSKAKVFGVDTILQWSRFSDPSQINNELSASVIPDYSHGGYLILSGGITFETFVLPYFADVPLSVDADNNTVPDFFEASQPIAAGTTGIYQDPTDPDLSQVVNFTWARAAGSSSGTVSVEVPQLGLTFPATFSILDYAGTLDYTQAGNDITATFSTTLAGGTNRIDGAAEMTVGNGGLGWKTGSPVFKDAGGATLALDFPAGLLGRTGNLFSAGILFSDGAPETPLADFKEWILDFTATDANNNGTPDIVETVSAKPPVLSIRPGADDLIVTITGESGRTYDLEKAAHVTGAAWEKIDAATLDGVSAEIHVPKPADGEGFFRAQAR